MKIYNMRPDKLGRNSRIWAAVTIAGLTYEQVGAQEGLSMQRIGQIVSQVERTIPPEEKDRTRTYRREFLNELRAQCMEMALQDPTPLVAANGRPITHADGRPALDYSGKLSAIDRLLKIDERYAKLTGTDNAVEHSVTVTAEAVQATKDAADNAGKQFSLIIPESPEVLAHVSKGG